MSVYDDDALVGRLTQDLAAKGHTIFQIHRLADDDRTHVKKLGEMFAPPMGAKVLDIGCGIGRVAELMVLDRPDLEFTLLNVSASQLAMCPESLLKVQGHMHATSLSDGSFDAAMLCYALGHGVVERVLKEASRVLRSGGVLFIYDMVSHPPRTLKGLDYTLFSSSRVCEAAEEAGLRLDWLKSKLKTTVADFLSVMPLCEYTETFSGVTPIAYRFVKC